MPFKPLSKLLGEKRGSDEKKAEPPPEKVIEVKTYTPKGGDKQDPGGWRRFLLDEDPIIVTDIEKSFTEDNVRSGIATAQYDNVVQSAVADKSFEVSLIDVWNNSGADRTVAFRFGTGTLRFEKKIADKTGFLLNLVKTKWKGPLNTAFNIYCYESTPAVSYTVFGEMT